MSCLSNWILHAITSALESPFCFHFYSVAYKTLKISVYFVSHWHNYRLNWTPLSPITITNNNSNRWILRNVGEHVRLP